MMLIHECSLLFVVTWWWKTWCWPGTWDCRLPCAMVWGSRAYRLSTTVLGVMWRCSREWSIRTWSTDRTVPNWLKVACIDIAKVCCGPQHAHDSSTGEGIRWCILAILACVLWCREVRRSAWAPCGSDIVLFQRHCAAV